MKSIIHRSKFCFICGCKATDEHHVFMGDKQRDKSEQYGLKVNLCRRHHEAMHNPKTFADKMAIEFVQETAQREFERQIGDRQMFINEFGRTYL